MGRSDASSQGALIKLAVCSDWADPSLFSEPQGPRLRSPLSDPQPSCQPHSLVPTMAALKSWRMEGSLFSPPVPSPYTPLGCNAHPSADGAQNTPPALI